ncbi:hypothetical protein MKX07_007068 [Trichoderma sp. CBMAI-0711]|nr:hypothetical protein MKX07_007068 [Trichoderma sp. CBMAI-0711]
MLIDEDMLSLTPKGEGSVLSSVPGLVATPGREMGDLDEHRVKAESKLLENARECGLCKLLKAAEEGTTAEE